MERKLDQDLYPGYVPVDQRKLYPLDRTLYPGYFAEHEVYECGVDLRSAIHKLASTEPFDHNLDRKRSLDVLNRVWAAYPIARDRRKK